MITAELMLEEFKDKYTDMSTPFDKLPDPINEQEFQIMEDRFKKEFSVFYESGYQHPESLEQMKKRFRETAKRRKIPYEQVQQEELAKILNSKNARAKRKYLNAKSKFGR